MSLDLRECNAADFDGVSSLLVQLWPQRNLDFIALREAFNGGLASSWHKFCVAEEDSVLVGFSSLSIRVNLRQAGYLAVIDEMVVRAEFRGRGIGTGLLDHMIALAKTKGCERVELTSAFHRTEAHKFYEHRGFESRGYLFSKALPLLGS